MGAIYHTAVATRENDALSILFEHTDNGSPRVVARYTSKPGASKRSILDMFGSDCSGGFEVIERAMARVPDDVRFDR